MTNPESKLTVQPTLVIGLGGTGVSVLRQLKKEVAKNSPAGDRLVLLGIDLDPASNARLKGPDAPPVLSSREFVELDFQALSDFVENINAREPVVSGAVAGSTLAPVYPTILQWFKEFPPGSNRRIGVGQTKDGGAGQWRSLGRVGLHLDIVKAMKAIRASMDAAYGHVGSLGVRHAHVIASVAGGTGSGMFLDIGYLLTHMMRDIEVTGHFLLPEAFLSVDKAGRIYQNAFAALMELSELKNQRREFEVALPGDNLSISRRVGGEGPFATVNLYSVFPMDKATSASPPQAGMLSHTYDRIAQVVLAACRHDIIRALASHRRNNRGDRGEPPSSARAGWVFSTAVAMHLPTATLDDVTNVALRSLCERRIGVLKSVLQDPLGIPSDVSNWHEESKRQLAQWWDTLVGEARRCREDVIRQIQQCDGSTDNWLAILSKFPAQKDGSRVISHRLLHDLFDLATVESAAQRRLDEIVEGRIRSLTALRPADRVRATDMTLEFVGALPTNPEFSPGEHEIGVQLPTFSGGVMQHIANLLLLSPAVTNESRIRNSAKDLAALLGTMRCGLSVEWWTSVRSKMQSAFVDFRKQASIETSQEVTRVQRIETEAAHLGQSLTPRQITPLADAFDNMWSKLPTTHALLEAFGHWPIPFDAPSTCTAHLTELARKCAQEFLTDEESIEHVVGTVDDVEARMRGSVSSVFRKRREMTPVEAAVVFLPSLTGCETFNGHVQNTVLPAIERGLNQPIEYEELAWNSEGLVYFERRSHAPNCIDRIVEYQAAYLRHEDWERAYFHTDYRFVDLPLLADTAIAPAAVPCGNSGCGTDLRGVDRSQVFCPECRGLIRTRCGNVDCSSDELDKTYFSRLEAWRSDPNRDPSHPPLLCPSCNLLVRSAWWECRSGHRPVPSGQTECPECVAESQAGIRLRDHVSVDRRNLAGVCPNCHRLGRKRPFFVGAEIWRRMNDGLQVEDLGRLPELAGTRRLVGHPRIQCPDCEAVLIPCDFVKGAIQPGQLLARSGGAFVGPPGVKYKSCSHCDFPLRSDIEEASCPRCRRRLHNCRICGAMCEKVLSPLGGGERCSNCQNPARKPTVRWSLDDWSLDQGLAVCINLYECTAARRLTWANAPADSRECRVCRDQLQLTYTMANMVELCPICSKLDLLPGVQHVAPSATDSGACVLCGGMRRQLSDLGGTSSASRSPAEPSLDDIIWLCKTAIVWTEDNGGARYAIAQKFQSPTIPFDELCKRAKAFFTGVQGDRLASVLDKMADQWLASVARSH